MKKEFRSTLVVGLLVAGVAGYTFYDYSQSLKEGDVQEYEKRAFKIPADEVTGIKMVRDGESLELRKDGTTWRMDKPVEDLGDTPSIDGFMYPLLSQKLRQIKEEKITDLAEFGFDDKSVEIEVRGQDKSESIRISSKNAFDGSFYVAQDGQVWLGDRGLATLKERPVSSFRSRRVWREVGKTVQSASAEGAHKFTAVRKDGVWTLEPKPKFEVDPEKIDEWISRVQDFMPADFEKENPSADELKSYLLTKPEYRIAFEFEGGQWSLSIGPERAGDVFVMASSRPTVYKTSVAAVAGLKKRPEDFRQGRVFRFPVEEARRIEVRTAKVTGDFVKDGDSWKAEKGELNSERLVEFIQSLQDLEAEQFDVAGAKGLKNPQVRVLDKDGKVLLALTIGDEYKRPGVAGPGADFRYVKAGAEVFGVQKDRVDRLVPEDLLKVPQTSEKK